MRMGFVVRDVINQHSVKKSANLTVNSDLLAEAKRLKINLSATLEKALQNEVSERRKAEWLAQNAEAIDACNELAETHGLFSDKYRPF